MVKKLMVGVLATAMVATGGTLAFAGDGGNDGGDDDGDVIRLSARTVTEEEVDLGATGFGPVADSCALSRPGAMNPDGRESGSAFQCSSATTTPIPPLRC